MPRKTSAKKLPKGSNLNTCPASLMSEELAEQLQVRLEFNDDSELNFDMFKNDGTCMNVDHRHHQTSDHKLNSSNDSNHQTETTCCVNQNSPKFFYWDSVEHPMGEFSMSISLTVII